MKQRDDRIIRIMYKHLDGLENRLPDDFVDSLYDALVKAGVEMKLKEPREWWLCPECKNAYSAEGNPGVCIHQEILGSTIRKVQCIKVREVLE